MEIIQGKQIFQQKNYIGKGEIWKEKIYMIKRD